jgi:hypothetical protein
VLKQLVRTVTIQRQRVKEPPVCEAAKVLSRTVESHRSSLVKGSHLYSGLQLPALMMEAVGSSSGLFSYTRIITYE